jgi:hypothetical protein
MRVFALILVVEHPQVLAAKELGEKALEPRSAREYESPGAINVHGGLRSDYRDRSSGTTSGSRRPQRPRVVADQPGGKARMPVLRPRPCPSAQSLWPGRTETVSVLRPWPGRTEAEMPVLWPRMTEPGIKELGFSDRHAGIQWAAFYPLISRTRIRTMKPICINYSRNVRAVM